ncbi:arylacetamide deacetylase-like 4 [Morphnus guianensis]
MGSQIAFTRYVRSGRKPGPDPQLSMRDARFGRVPGRVYRPRAPSAGLRAGAIFCHGGGWLYCSFGRAGRVVPSPAQRDCALPLLSSGGGGNHSAPRPVRRSGNLAELPRRLRAA